MTNFIKYAVPIFLLIVLGCNTKNENYRGDEVIKIDKKIGIVGNNTNSPELQLNSYLITNNRVGIFKKGMTIIEVSKLIPKNQIVKKIGYGEFVDDTYDDYEIYDEEMNHLLTITSKNKNDLSSTINRILIVSDRYRTESGISLKSTYNEIIKSYKILDYMPDTEHIVLTVDSLGAWFGIKKTELQKEWWNDKEKKIDISKIPPNSKVDSFVIWWNRK